MDRHEDLTPFETTPRNKPRHFFLEETEQYRVKLQRFSTLNPECTLQRVSFDRDVKAYRWAADMGRSQVTRPTPKPRDPSAKASAESLELTTRRAKKQVRLRVKELAPSALVTFTTRGIYTLDQLLDIWQRFNRLSREAGDPLEYVCVPEPHPKNPTHLHLHAAVRGVLSVKTLRRLWHAAIQLHLGLPSPGCTLRGPESPGNIDVQAIRGRDLAGRVAKIAKYISKYISKDLLEVFGRRRYWNSKGISVEAAQVFWLDSLDYNEAMREARMLFGGGGSVDELAALRPFMPSDRVAWWVQDPEKLDPPF